MSTSPSLWQSNYASPLEAQIIIFEDTSSPDSAASRASTCSFCQVPLADDVGGVFVAHWIVGSE